MTFEHDGRYLTVTEWRLTEPNHAQDGLERKQWQSFLRDVIPPVVPDLRFVGLIELWACLAADGRMWIVGLHSSESSVGEGFDAWQASNNGSGKHAGDGRMIRSYSGPLVDVGHVVPGTTLRTRESIPAPSVGQQWIQLTRWRVRPDGESGPDQVGTVLNAVGPLVIRHLGNQRPMMAWVADSGDDTVTFAALFSSPTASEAAWESMRQPGTLRDATDRHLILLEFVGGEVVDLFAFAARAQARDAPDSD